MTREEVNHRLRHMERIREDSSEAETARQRRNLDRQYAVLWHSIEPYVNGKLPYSDERP